MATVLIIATDQIIGGLLGQLAELAGHAAQFRRSTEESGEAIRQTRPAIVMIDAAYGRLTLDRAAGAAREVGAPIVYFAATLSASELRQFALQRGAKYFALPAGPKLLRRVLASALEGGAPSRGWTPTGPGAVSAAAEAVARARALADRNAAIRSESRALRAEHEANIADCRTSYADLREAVIAYTRELRGAGVPPDRTLELVKAAVRSEVAEARAPQEIGRALDDALEWCLQAYYAA